MGRCAARAIIVGGTPLVESRSGSGLTDHRNTKARARAARAKAGRRARGVLRGRALVALLGCLCPLVAGCGGSSAPITQQQEVSSYVAFAACLNKHGVEVSAARTGGLVWEAGPGLPSPGSPQALAAERDCKSLVPEGGLNHAPTPAQTAQSLALLLRFAKCMRAHGVRRVLISGHERAPGFLLSRPLVRRTRGDDDTRAAARHFRPRPQPHPGCRETQPRGLMPRPAM
jgi:hypothetical protein